MCVPSSEGGWSCETQWNRDCWGCLSSSFPRKRIGEGAKWFNLGPFRFVLFRIPNRVQAHQNPVGKGMLSTWLLLLCPYIASVLLYPIHCLQLFQPRWSQPCRNVHSIPSSTIRACRCWPNGRREGGEGVASKCVGFFIGCLVSRVFVVVCSCRGWSAITR